MLASILVWVGWTAVGLFAATLFLLLAILLTKAVARAWYDEKLRHYRQMLGIGKEPLLSEKVEKRRTIQ